MTKIFLRWIPVALLFLPLVAHSAPANRGLPPRLLLLFKEKMSCREVKRLVKRSRVFIHCDPEIPRARTFAAEYYGKDSVDTVLKELSKMAPMQNASLYQEHAFP